MPASSSVADSVAWRMNGTRATELAPVCLSRLSEYAAAAVPSVTGAFWRTVAPYSFSGSGRSGAHAVMVNTISATSSGRACRRIAARLLPP